MNSLRDVTVRQRDWAAAMVVTLAAVALMLVPYIAGYAFAGPSLVYTGIVMNPEDSQSYFAKMLEGYDGQWLYTIPFTVEEHAPAFVGGFYLALGHVARFVGLSLDAMWHLSRAVSAFILYLSVYGFCEIFLPDRRKRWTAFMLAVFGSGLGWILFLLNRPYWLDTFPVDFKMPEAHLFFGALTFPHVAIGTSLILVSLCLVRRIMAGRGGWLYAIAAGLAYLGIGIAYPFLIYLIALTVALYWVSTCVAVRRIMWRDAFLLGVGFAIAAPLFLEYARTLATNLVFRAWDMQAITPSPPLPHYLIAYGIMLLLALLTVVRDRRFQHPILWAWLAAVALLVYAPLNPQRRFVEGVQVPLAILAIEGLFDCVLPWLERTGVFRRLAVHPRYSVSGLERLGLVLFIGFMCLSNLYILTSLTITMALQQPFPLFRSRGEAAAVDWLRANTPRSTSVLGDYETGSLIAARAGNRVVLGHWAETADYPYMLDQVMRFFTGNTDDAWRQDVLRKYDIDYVWAGPREAELGSFAPNNAMYLTPVYSNSEVSIYRVTP